ncbi:hypothetical protein [Ruegeria sp. HKCCD7303]|uniref:hypothetical protein n=1 Tax=Ruegeria sp. HKCCD7303 TaxID=2683013 RepID=UPI00149093D9|nr:hypothetical protein [Ruegeria sp. HKCCD7303]NOD67606.1 hypothetical protein [Ruegeria sp. HKCCD7303]
MTEQKKPIWRPSVIVAILLSWLGLAGLSDAFVEWKDWFEFGVMNHWRALKTWLLQWVPFKVPFWFVDYIVLSAVFNRSYLSADDYTPLKSIRKILEEADAESEEMTSATLFVAKALIAILFILFAILAWPFLLVNITVQNLCGKASPVHRSALKAFTVSVLTFIPILFVLTNEILPMMN